MNKYSQLDSLLKGQANTANSTPLSEVYNYARSMAAIENVIAVVSDLRSGTSRIFNGAFADILGVADYNEENSIWEKKILSLMSETEQEEKLIAELRFFHYLKRIGRGRQHRYLMSKLKFNDRNGRPITVLHRMYYIYDSDSDAVSHAICLYGPLSVDFKGKSVAVNSLTGVYEELNPQSDSKILSSRERQVLSLIDSGLKSREIAEKLNISLHTVSRHRQEILSKLQVKNSIEACRLARSMELF